eukprot:GHVU01210748.1.p1 GENE.GHVU01210748.1~~GHVU01210748.1.p1  ORF type:complete len:194 (+),score=19.44 GHVU01210748.1:497-1078(+)
MVVYATDGPPFQTDGSLNPVVVYTAFPEATRVILGGRKIEVAGAHSVKMQILHNAEDLREIWTSRAQHAMAFNAGDFHSDFEDVNVAFSMSYPQTHILFRDYALHIDSMLTVNLVSYNAIVRLAGQPDANTWDNVLNTCCTDIVHPPDIIEVDSILDAHRLPAADHYHAPEMSPMIYPYVTRGDVKWHGDPEP